MVLDVPVLPDSSSEEDEESDTDELTLELSRDRPSRRGLRTLHISRLLQMVLQDAQTRLFFKAQSVIQSEIRYYVPKPEDLAFPEKLICESDLLLHLTKPGSTQNDDGYSRSKVSIRARD